MLDGAMATMIQALDLTEADFRGAAFADHGSDLVGCNEALVLSRPDLIEEIHRGFLEAGTDIVETNSFNAAAISLADYDLADRAYEFNVEAARIARKAVDSFGGEIPRFVAGGVGPTNSTLLLSPDVNDPGFRSRTFDEVVAAYYDQARGLGDGGADLILVETVFDTLTLKAGLFGIEQSFRDSGRRLPLIISVTVTDLSGRTLSGQTVEAFWESIAFIQPLCVGINCSLGAADMRTYVEALATCSGTYVHCYPNAGLPDEFGEYDDTPEHMAKVLSTFAESGWLNLVGGCCGTTPDHIRAIREAMQDKAPRCPEGREKLTRFSGLEPFEITADTNFVMVGERTNATGSRRFARLIKTEDYGSVLDVARDQVEGGANIIDVNMDEGLLDSAAGLTRFLNLIASELDISRVPIMVDSSDLEVIEAGLKCVQGKAIVNSISLEEGEEAFVQAADVCRRYGAAVVVMAFDEEGQASSIDRKVAICEQAYGILTEKVGFDPTDIIFDPNILTVATGIEEHNHRLGAVLPYVGAARGLSGVAERPGEGGGSTRSLCGRSDDVGPGTCGGMDRVRRGLRILSGRTGWGRHRDIRGRGPWERGPPIEHAEATTGKTIGWLLLRARGLCGGRVGRDQRLPGRVLRDGSRIGRAGGALQGGERRLFGHPPAGAVRAIRRSAG